MHVGTESKSYVVRDRLYSLLRSLAQAEPGLINQLVTDALIAFLSREEKQPSNPITEEVERPVDYQTRLSSILSASSALPEGTDSEVRKQIITNLIALAHHKRICELLQPNSIDGSVNRSPQRLPHNSFGLRFVRGRMSILVNSYNRSWMTS